MATAVTLTPDVGQQLPTMHGYVVLSAREDDARTEPEYTVMVTSGQAMIRVRLRAGSQEAALARVQKECHTLDPHARIRLIAGPYDA